MSFSLKPTQTYKTCDTCLEQKKNIDYVDGSIIGVCVCCRQFEQQTGTLVGSRCVYVGKVSGRDDNNI